MQIPNAHSAVIESVKLHGYLLSGGHSVGRFKAPFFLTLGYSAEDWPRLEADSRTQHLPQDATLGGGRDRRSGGKQMTYRVLDTFVLERDLPDHGLRKGDLGAVVEVCEPDGIDLVSVRPSPRSA